MSERTRQARYGLASGAVMVTAAMVATAACIPAPTASNPPTSTGAPAASGAQLVDVGDGRTLYLECHGDGIPTVVLLSGFGNAGDTWQVTDLHPPAVADGVQRFTRVCLYDRPGSYVTTVVAQDGRRIPASSVDQIHGGGAARGTAVASATAGGGAPVVAQLHRLLAAAGIPPPYVLVGHSLGGMFSLLYARTYPEQVTGLVLVDAPTPGFFERLSPAVRALANAAQSDPGPSAVPGYVNERYDFETIFAEINAAAPLPRIPVTYLSKTDADPMPDPLPAGLTPATFTDIGTQRSAAAAAYLSTIPGSRFVLVPGTTHYVQNQRPDVVIDAIRDTLAGKTMTATPTGTG
jgi:pimeloyl-ACP methyl ester carboxylesterase